MRSLLKHRCVIQHNTPQNVDGVMVPSWANVATNVPLLLQDDGGGTALTPAGQVYTKPGTAYFPPGTNLRPRADAPSQPARILLTKHPSLAGVYFTVQDVGDESGMGHHLVARVIKLPNMTS